MRRGRIILGAAIVALGITSIVGVRHWRATERLKLIAPVLTALPQHDRLPEEARSRLNEAVRRARTGDVAALGEASRLFHANGFLAEAIRCYSVLERLQPKEPRWFHRHATILAGYGDNEPALARWKAVTALAPDYIIGHLRLGDLLLKENRQAEAAVVYNALLAREPGNSYAELGLARIDIENGRWSQARDRLEKIVRATHYALGYDLIVTVYERLGLAEHAAAVRSRNKASGAHRDPPDPWTTELLDWCFDPYQLALAAGDANRNGDAAMAIRLLGRAATLAPTDPSIPFQLAGVYSERREFNLAREQLERCTVIAPTFADGWAHLTALLEQSGDVAGAERSLNKGLTHCPESPGLHLMRARIHRKAGRVTDAIAAYRTSIRLRANEAEPYVELATLLLQANAGAEAIASLHKALEAEPDHPTALTVLALHALSISDEAAARHWLGRVRVQPRVPASQVQQLLATYRQQFGRAFE
jgi:predicted Zn-dependent protease